MSPDQTDEVFGTHMENVSHVIGFLVPLLDPRALALPVKVGMPLQVMELMRLYPQTSSAIWGRVPARGGSDRSHPSSSMIAETPRHLTRDQTDHTAVVFHSARRAVPSR